MLWVKVCSCPLKFSLTATWGKVSKAGFFLSQMRSSVRTSKWFFLTISCCHWHQSCYRNVRASFVFKVCDIHIENIIKSYAKHENNRSPPYIFLGHPLHNPLVFTQKQIHLQMHSVVIFKYIVSSLMFLCFLLFNFIIISDWRLLCS